jgi:hypothetical protein
LHFIPSFLSHRASDWHIAVTNTLPFLTIDIHSF